MLTIVRATLVASLCLTSVFAQQLSNLPPLPSELPPSALPRPEPIVRQPRITLPRSQATPTTLGSPTALGAVRPIVPAQSYQPTTVGDDILAWDAINKEYNAQLGEAAANFMFSVTNVSKTNVVINWVRPSCGCTVAKLPPVPWTLTPGEAGKIELTVDLRNKFGILSKYVSVDTSAGQKLLNLKITVPQQTQPVAGTDARARNMQVAMADRQAVFRGDCATCHAVPTVAKKGEALYQAACAICHDAPHRATMVPDLRALKNATGKDYWTHWVTDGKPGSLMPAFAAAQGGPLNNEQIQSLADFLYERFPKASTATAALPSANTTTASIPAPNSTAAAKN